MKVRPPFAIGIGALLTAIIAIVGGARSDDELAAKLAANAQQTINQAGGEGITARFSSLNGWPSRHAVLSGAENIDDAKRAEIAQSVSRLPGVGGVFWADGTMIAERGEREVAPLHCQDDIEAILGSRTIRFEESSAKMDPASYEVIEEVALALRPCLGAVIAIIGHTDASGDEAANIALSRQRAQAVRQTLVDLQLPAEGLRASGVGSSVPVEGLADNDPANRRIEFSVIATVPLVPTPVDTPGAR